MMNSHGAVILLVVTTVWPMSHSLAQDELCISSLQAPEGSPWKTIGVAPVKVPLSEVMRLAKKHDLTLEKRTPTSLDSQDRLEMTCEHLGDMWMALPSPAEDYSTFGCWFERLMEAIHKLVGKMKKKPNQYPDSPPRKYMKNFCGRKLPMASPSSDTGRRMDPNTRDMQKKLRQILNTM